MSRDVRQSIAASEQPPAGLASHQRALWLDGIGEWQAAHELVQDGKSREECLVHAYLHRKEGDIGNAEYWYQRGRAKIFSGSLEEEWEALLVRFFYS